jgi:hypothetical protein
MSSKKNEKDLPTLLVIQTKDEDWVKLCSEYSSKFKVIQTTWDKIFLSSYSDLQYPMISIYACDNPLYPSQKKMIDNIKPNLLLIRNLVRSISPRIDSTPDYRNILYGFYHSNVPMINELSAIIAEIEKPIMYGRLRKIRDKYGEKIFPLIKQYYYPNYSQIGVTPNVPYVLKVSYPHAGLGKIRINDYHDTEDIKSILALHKDYCAIEPFIDVDYELRIVFIAPNYYRVHKRQSMNWKVNFGMTNIREDCEMKPNWKKWIDLIYENYPDLLIFDIDALVDKNGKEYILEVNGSTQGFTPEHGDQDLEHLRDLVVRKMETILGEELLNKDNEAKKLFIENKNDVNIINNEDEKDTKIINLQNLVDDYKKKLKDYENNYLEILDELNTYKNKGNKISFQLIIFVISIIILILGIYWFMRK